MKKQLSILTSFLPLLTVIITFLLAYNEHREYRESLVEFEQRRLLVTVKSLALQIEETIHSYENFVLNLSANPKITNDISNPDSVAVVELEHKKLQSIIGHPADNSSTLALLDAEGKTLFRSPVSNATPDSLTIGNQNETVATSDNRMYKGVPNTVFVNDPKEPAISITKPLFSKGESVGALKMNFSISKITKKLQKNEQLEQKQSIFLLDNRGYFLYHSSLTFGENNPDNRVTENEELYPGEEQSSRVEFIHNLQAGKSGVETIYFDFNEGEQSLRPKKNILAYAPVHVGDTVWPLIVKSDYEKLVLPIKRHAASMVVLALFIIMLGSVTFFNYTADKKREELKREAVHTRRLKESMEQARQSEERVRLLLDSTAEGIYGMDMDGNCNFCNTSALRMFRAASEEDLLGQNMHRLIHHTKTSGEKFHQRDCKICSVLSGVENVHVDDEMFWRLDGTGFNAEYWSYPMIKSGQLVGAVVTFLDITNRLEMQEIAMRSSHMVCIGELAAGVAHEINNPINNILLNTQFLLDTPDVNDVEKKEIFKRNEAECQRIANIVSSLLSFSRADSKEKIPGTIKDIFEETLQLISAQLAKNSINVEIDIPDQLPRVVVNAKQIVQVFLNLLSNSMYALLETDKPDKTITIQATLQTKLGSGYVQTVFYDNGVGINENAITKILNPFFTTKPSGKGTGLGLSISHGIIVDHDGNISVESIEGQYTKVYVNLPCVPGDIS